MQTVLGQKISDAEKLENEKAAAQIRQLEGGQAAIPLREGLAAEPVAAPQLESAPTPIEAPVERAPAAAMPQEKSGIDALAGAEGGLGVANVKAISDAEMARSLDEQKLAAQQKAKQDAVADKVKKIDELKIAPGGFWSKRSTGEKIFAGVGLFFSALTPQGAQNAVKMINDEVDRDIMLQEKNLAKEQGALAQLNKELGDIDAAKAALSVKHLQNLQLKIQENSERFRGPLAQAKAKMAEEEIGRQIAVKQQEMMIKLAEKQEKNAGKMVSLDGYEFRAPTEQEAKTFREAFSDVQTAKQGLKKLIDLSSKGSSLSIEDRAEAETTAAMVRGALRTTLVGQGAVSDTERAILEKVVANPLELTRLNSASRKSLETILKRADIGIQNKAKSLGWQNKADKFASFKR